MLRFDAGHRLSAYEPPPPTTGAPGTPWSWLRDGDSMLRNRTLGDGRTMSLTPFDSAGRVTQVQLARGVLDITYDPTHGALDTATMPAGATGEARQSLDWDFDGPLLTRLTYGGLVTGVIDFGHDPNTWELTSEQLGGTTLTYAYDHDGLVTSAGVSTNPLVIQRGGSGTSGSIEFIDVGGAPDGAGRRAVSTSAAFDMFGRSERWTTSWPGGGQYQEELQYFSDANRIRCRTEANSSGTSGTLRYAYDDAGRLTHVYDDPGCADAGTPVATYAYDAQGNRTSWTDDLGSFIGVYDDQDRLQRMERPDGSESIDVGLGGLGAGIFESPMPSRRRPCGDRNPTVGPPRPANDPGEPGWGGISAGLSVGPPSVAHTRQWYEPIWVPGWGAVPGGL